MYGYVGSQAEGGHVSSDIFVCVCVCARARACVCVVCVCVCVFFFFSGGQLAVKLNYIVRTKIACIQI